MLTLKNITDITAEYKDIGSLLEWLMTKGHFEDVPL
jgi:hypothetical protein